MFGQSSSIVVVYIDRNRLQFYGGRLPAVLALDIPTVLARDLDIVNKDGLYTLVNQWLKQNNLGGAKLFFVLSPMTYFERVIVSTGESEQETEILSFYDSVPFDELATRVLTLSGKKHAIAVNREFVESIRHAFMLQGFHIVAVIPAILLGTLAAKRWLDAEMGAYVLKHVDVLGGQNIVDLEEPGGPMSQPSSVPTAKNNPRLMIMVGILGVLLLVLIFFAFFHR